MSQGIGNPLPLVPNPFFLALPGSSLRSHCRSCHWMLRRDISRRPRVEDLERLPNLAISLRETRIQVKEIGEKGLLKSMFRRAPMNVPNS